MLNTPVALLVWRLLLVYIALAVCRIAFWVFNSEIVGGFAWSDAWPIVCGALKFDTASVVYAFGLYVVMALLPLHIREREWYRRMMFGYYIFAGVALVAATNMTDCVYFRYTQKRLTADEFFFADNSNSVQLILKFMTENLTLVAVFMLVSVMLVAGYRHRVREQSILNRGWAYYIGSALIMALAAGLAVAGVRGGMTRMTRPITLSNALLYTPDANRANIVLSNPFCIIRTMGSSSSVRPPHYYDEPQLSELFTPEHAPADSARVNLAGRNVMLFICESMSAEHSAHLRPDLYAATPEKGFTPFLDSLMRDGLCFKNMYANGTRSIQAMPSVLGSIPSFKTPFVLMPQSLGESRQLPAILADKGYSTAFFCGSERGSMGFGAYARSAGIERLVSREDYEAAHGTGDFDGFWGIWDEDFMQFAGEEVGRLSKPFFATMFTLSSHHPFVVPERYRQTLPAGYTKIHRGIAYEDMAFRNFFGRFGNEPWFRNTIFVFVADHVSSERFDEQTNLYPANMHIMGFIYTPDGALRGDVEEITQQIDIMPTLLGLLGNREPYFAFGRDVLNEPLRPAWSVSYDGEFRALSAEGVTVVPETPTDKIAADSLQERFRALIQQYYTRIERKNYTVTND